MATHTKLTDAEKAKEVMQIKDSDRWPCWPVLPMKRHVDGGLTLGIIIANRLPHVYETSMFVLQNGPLDEQLKNVKRHEYDSYEAMVDDGWVGD